MHFMPLIEAMQARVQGWQAKYLTLAGRTTLIKSVLSSIPLHFLQALKLPNWVVNEMDKIRRSFLWKGQDKCSGGHCLVNWETCTLPKKNGGLGIIHLPTQNDALLVRWLWKLLSEPNSVWSKTIQEIYGSNDITSLSSSVRLSHNMKCLLQLAPLLKGSVIKDTQSQEWKWRWTSDKVFSAKSLYNFVRQPGCLSPYHRQLWSVKVPPKVKFFLWLILLNKNLTMENLQRRGWPSNTHCVFCGPGILETNNHLFLQCRFAREVYAMVNRAICPRASTSHIEDHWRMVRTQPSHEIVWLATTWAIWKERNLVIFQGSTPCKRRVAAKSLQDAAFWSSLC